MSASQFELYKSYFGLWNDIHSLRERKFASGARIHGLLATGLVAVAVYSSENKIELGLACAFCASFAGLFGCISWLIAIDSLKILQGRLACELKEIENLEEFQSEINFSPKIWAHESVVADMKKNNSPLFIRGSIQQWFPVSGLILYIMFACYVFYLWLKLVAS